jgi:predicted TPR repeat methyltransferase
VPGADDGAALLARARALRTTQEAIALYRDWAATYDRDVFERAGVIGSGRIADLLAEHVPDRATTVVDLGCGTGAVAARLREHGFAAIDGFDISPEMLAVADGKALYRTLRVVDLKKPLPPETPAGYGAAVSAGTFIAGHVGAEVVPAIARLLAKGGALACVVGAPLWPSFEAALTTERFDILRAALEPIRAGGAPEAFMVLARRG